MLQFNVSVLRILFVMVPNIRAMLKDLQEKVKAGELDRSDLEAIISIALIDAQQNVVDLFAASVDEDNPSV